MMPQSARILTTACPKPAVPLEDCQREHGRATLSASPRNSRLTGPSSLSPSCTVWSLGSLSEADPATGAVLQTLLALHHWHQMARPRVERRGHQESQPAHQSVHLVLGPGALGWPRHKNARRKHAKNSLLHRAPSRKARSWCCKKSVTKIS